ncbi:hypothetical protein [Moraxella sp. TY6]
MIKELCEQYWLLDGNHKFVYKIGELADNFQMKAYEISKVVKEHSVLQSTNILCRTCQTPFLFHTRTDLQQKNIHDWQCTECRQVEQESERQQQFKLEQQISQEKIAMLDENYEQAIQHPFDVEKLSIKEMIYLLALLRFSADENLQFIHSIDEIQSAVKHLSIKPKGIVTYLYKHNIIVISPASDLKNIIVEGDNFKYYPLKVEWLLTNHQIMPMWDTISCLEKRLKDKGFIKENLENLIEMSLEIALQECISYLEYQVDVYNLHFQVGDKTVRILKDELTRHPVSQVYSFILKAVKNAILYYSKGLVSKKQAANIIPNNIQKAAEDDRANGWHTRYNRIKDIPQSILSKTLYDSVLQQDDGGFHYTYHECVSNFLTKSNVEMEEIV